MRYVCVWPSTCTDWRAPAADGTRLLVTTTQQEYTDMAEKEGSDLIAALRKAFSRLGTPDGTNGTKTPRVNDSNLEFAISKVLKGIADEREQAARQGVLVELGDAIAKANSTRMNVFSSKYSSLDAQVIKGQSRINRDALRVVLAKRVGVKVADEIIAEASITGDPQLRLYPSIVSTDE